MRYFPVECASVTGPAFSCATFEQQGQWLNLLTYCAGQENGGRIEGAAELPAVFFQRSLAMSKKEFESECPLWTWDGPDLVVKFYPLQNQEKCEALRESGRKGGKTRAAKAKAEKQEANAQADAQANASTDYIVPNPTQSHKTKEDPTQQNSTQSPPGEPASADYVKTWTKEIGGKGFLENVGVGSGSAVTLNDLYRKIETLKIDPHNRLRAQDIARKLWDDTEGGKRLGGKPVKDLRAVLMTRLQSEGVIKKKRK